MKLLVINGPNLNLLGLREPAIYGSQNYEALLALIRTACDAEGIEVGFVQSNHEGTIVDAIQAAYGVYDGIIINPAAYTHTSHSGRAEGRGHSRRGGPHLRCGQPGTVSSGLLRRHGLRQDL